MNPTKFKEEQTEWTTLINTLEGNDVNVRQLSDRTGIAYSSIYQWKRRIPTYFIMLKKLCEELGVTPSYLLDFTSHEDVTQVKDDGFVKLSTVDDTTMKDIMEGVILKDDERSIVNAALNCYLEKVWSSVKDVDVHDVKSVNDTMNAVLTINELIEKTK